MVNDALKVLVSAYACDPTSGSEPGAGWAWACASARSGNIVWLVTRTNNRDAIDAELERHPELRIHPVYFDLPPSVRRWKRGGLALRIYYAAWQCRASRVMRRLHAAHRFDLSHHLTFAVDWLPAAVLTVPGLRGIWGPVGGTGSVPVTLYPWLGVWGVVREVMRELIVRPLRAIFGARMARNATIVVAQNDEVARRFAKLANAIFVEPNVALSGTLPQVSREAPTSQGRVMLFVGRLVPLKGLKLAVAALAELPGDWTLEVVGDGPDGRRCAKYASRIGVGHRVRFLGALPREDTLGRIAHADVMVFPSMHDSAGWVVGEACALGTPVVCLDLAGPGTMIRRGGGVAIPSGPAVEQRMARAIVRSLGKAEPSNMWSDERLVGLTAELYIRVLSTDLPERRSGV
jgi:glycosyltransferase involved in cell wall biosynthesis